MVTWEEKPWNQLFGKYKADGGFSLCSVRCQTNNSLSLKMMLCSAELPLDKITCSVCVCVCVFLCVWPCLQFWKMSLEQCNVLHQVSDARHKCICVLYGRYRRIDRSHVQDQYWCWWCSDSSSATMRCVNSTFSDMLRVCSSHLDREPGNISVQ